MKKQIFLTVKQFDKFRKDNLKFKYHFLLPGCQHGFDIILDINKKDYILFKIKYNNLFKSCPQCDLKKELKEIIYKGSKTQSKLNKFFAKIVRKITGMIFSLAQHLPPKSRKYTDEYGRTHHIDPDSHYEDEIIDKTFFKKNIYKLANWLWDIEEDYLYFWDKVIEESESKKRK